MATPATLLDSAIEEAILYWKANNGGNRAGLIADLVAVIGISSGTATTWTDAFTQQVFDLGMSTSSVYADFKTWLQTVGATRAEAGARAAFDVLKKGTLIQDARNQLIARLNDEIVITDGRITDCNAAITAAKALSPSTTKTVTLRALGILSNKLQSQRDAQVVERDRLAALVG